MLEDFSGAEGFIKPERFCVKPVKMDGEFEEKVEGNRAAGKTDKEDGVHWIVMYWPLVISAMKRRARIRCSGESNQGSPVLQFSGLKYSASS